MELKELALLTREEIEKEINKMCPYPANPENAYEVDTVLRERVNIRQSLMNLQVEALLDGKLTIEQVVAQMHTEQHDDDLDLDDVHWAILKHALDELKEGKDRWDVVNKAVDELEMF